MNPFAAIAAVPVCSVAPVNRSAEDGWFNPSGRDSRQSTSESVSQKNAEKKPSASKKARSQGDIQKEANYDFSRVPPPVCSCTGVARRCYKYGPGGWQSTCCTTSMSEYPLPIRPSKPGRRIAGRKMKSGAYKRLLCKLLTEGRDLSNAVDLKNYWGKHGSNNFVTIK